MKLVIGALAVALLLLNALGGIVGAIWLGILGKWSDIGLGLLAIFGGALTISLWMLPGFLLFAAPAAALIQRDRYKTGWAIGALNIVYTHVVLAAWCLLVMALLTRRADAASAIPAALWAYTVATAPISYMASKEQENEFTSFTCLVIQAASAITLACALILRPASATTLLAVFGSIVSLGLLLTLVVSFGMMREEATRHRLLVKLKVFD